MKKNLVFTFLFLFTLVLAQPRANRFEDDSQSAFENIDREIVKPNTEGSETGKGPGNPGAPVPINDYNPILIVTAFIIIYYKTRKNRNLLS